MSDYHWVMASCRLPQTPDGRGGLLTVAVSGYRDLWEWGAAPYDPREPGRPQSEIAGGKGYPDPISARIAAEYWLTVTREQNAMRAALESEVAS